MIPTQQYAGLVISATGVKMARRVRMIMRVRIAIGSKQQQLNNQIDQS